MFILASGPMLSVDVMVRHSYSPRELGRAAPKAVKETLGTEVEVKEGVMLG